MTAALPLWQPWASLVAIGAKRIETRHWPCPQRLIGERIAIHATKTDKHLCLCSEEPFYGYVPNRDGLPLGALIATVKVQGCGPITVEFAAEVWSRQPVEHAFGDYTPGRFAWMLGEPILFDEPVPWKGSQGIFAVPSRLVGVEPQQMEIA
jgi:hypothetical protein